MPMIHATCIAFDGRGVLLRGASGSGKSDLALRAIDAGAQLVADDQVNLARLGENVIASAPLALHGMIEIRGLGIMRVAAAAEAEIALVVDLIDDAALERMPERCQCDLLGIALPLLGLAPFQASALAKLRFALVAAAEPNRLMR
jgi:serine kinase of HPr protein (carbohydrate metabolism regulator)